MLSTEIEIVKNLRIMSKLWDFTVHPILDQFWPQESKSAVKNLKRVWVCDWGQTALTNGVVKWRWQSTKFQPNQLKNTKVLPIFHF